MAQTQQHPALSLPVFSQLLEPAGIVPAQDFSQSHVLLCEVAPDIELRHQIRFVMQAEVSFREAGAEEVRRLIRHWRAELSPNIETGNDDVFVSGYEDDEELKDLASEAPIIRLVNHLFARALDINASDIHFEPNEEHLEVRCRVDGIMHRIERLPVKITTAVASRLKLMARLDIGEKRLPQDGRIDYKLGSKHLDMRVSTLPGVHGESIVLRILDRSDTAVSLQQLGMPENILRSYQSLINQPHGMILITGPTGSGKTTTLYATLEKINDQTTKIITVEDPVEYQMEGITQIQANAAIGLNFAAGLRSIVRQDPDVIMVGEIRDHETAEIAIESALTGHLVFSTLHTNDAAGAITRLQDMGVEGYLISSSLLCVQAQRLVRRICPDCGQPHELTADEAAVLKVDAADYPMARKGQGCERCGGTGYRGRIGLYELLVMSDAIRHEIAVGSDANVIREQAIAEGMKTLREDALEKLAAGLTTPEEVVRVTRAGAVSGL
ncbi:GspE/PulE family protein [Pseudohongiella sp. SYSU M77423]|uniref:GspE/PulE family protein n=1 Tax=Pseudohongiella sp. SYSU M77423 TaxID=3042312 RepID=UPI000C3EA09B|nr:GspE/PulE family protein [Pseudohongiella sp. SYSU M77423]MAY55087.1 general secretion pathway protein GspE [Gammaproteobacteria bacterium]MEC8859673.1 GspE/PulE family protein [Pseudomonadota bacterium]HBN14298.1 general secretion pathway protein GspE [Pseudohongiella sp.]MBJ55421.1 general secretion pathway protein GspE [Gammaproteobacteria bacterium]MDH7944221.1 GspE/PulE family protein [Pseudohongiella sp. SYSU M77423]|tara:strand:+ start:5942 stop:7432 length:1491 start_codon:yes stop_codon:yes gene_type:complete